MIRFSLFGIPVQIQPFFWIVLVIIGGAQGADTPDAIFRIALFVIAGFISILIHELGHALTGRAFGARPAITLQAFGGLAHFTGARFSRPRSFLVTLAGPAAQIVLGLLAMVVMAGSTTNMWESHAVYFVFVLMAISFIWAVFNLLPILPLDGGQLLNAMLGPARIKVTLWTSIVTAIAGGVYLYLRDPDWWIGPIFLAFLAWESFKGLRENSWR